MSISWEPSERELNANKIGEGLSLKQALDFPSKYSISNIREQNGTIDILEKNLNSNKAISKFANLYAYAFIRTTGTDTEHAFFRTIDAAIFSNTLKSIFAYLYIISSRTDLYDEINVSELHDYFVVDETDSDAFDNLIAEYVEVDLSDSYENPNVWEEYIECVSEVLNSASPSQEKALRHFFSICDIFRHSDIYLYNIGSIFNSLLSAINANPTVRNAVPATPEVFEKWLQAPTTSNKETYEHSRSMAALTETYVDKVRNFFRSHTRQEINFAPQMSEIQFKERFALFDANLSALFDRLNSIQDGLARECAYPCVALCVVDALSDMAIPGTSDSDYILNSDWVPRYYDRKNLFSRVLNRIQKELSLDDDAMTALVMLSARYAVGEANSLDNWLKDVGINVSLSDLSNRTQLFVHDIMYFLLHQNTEDEITNYTTVEIFNGIALLCWRLQDYKHFIDYEYTH